MTKHRLPDFPPIAVPILPSATSWAGRNPPRAYTRPGMDDEFYDMVLAADDVKAFADSMDAAQEAIFRANMERRDQAAADYGEPESPHDFYAGRPGSQAETIVLDCLRKLEALPEIDRLFAPELTYVITKGYLETAPDDKIKKRRAEALLRVGGETECT